jgi:hypothetical protein
VEFIHRREVVDGQLVDILSRLDERGQYPVEQAALAVVLSHLFGRRAFLRQSRIDYDFIRTKPTI